MPPRLITNRLLDDLFPQRRSPGRHVSSAIKAVMTRLHPDRFTDTPIDLVRAALGNALEKALIDQLAEQHSDRYVRPGELEFEGFHGTPDLWDVRPDTVCRLCRKRCTATVEIKLTWASSRRAADIEDAWFWRYWQQIKAYDKMAGLHRGFLIIVFVVGDWRDGPPIGAMWEDEWPQEDLDETWDMVKMYASEEDHDDRPARRRRTKRQLPR